jgi:predicted transcriptional regulator
VVINTIGVWQRSPSLSSGKKKIKIEFEDADGSKYNLSLDGVISKNKILKVYELMETLNMSGGTSYGENDDRNRTNLGHEGMRTGDRLTSVGSKIWYIVENKFHNTTFTSTDIQEMYEEEYKESMRLDAIATYLSRYVNKDKLVRNKKGGKEWVYKIVLDKKAFTTCKNGNGRDLSQLNQYFDSEKQINLNNSSANSSPKTANTYSSLTEVN